MKPLTSAEIARRIDDAFTNCFTDNNAIGGVTCFPDLIGRKVQIILIDTPSEEGELYVLFGTVLAVNLFDELEHIEDWECPTFFPKIVTSVGTFHAECGAGISTFCQKDSDGWVEADITFF